MIQPYTRVRIAFIAQQLNVPAADVERLLINLILDKRVDGRIDQVRVWSGRGWDRGEVWCVLILECRSLLPARCGHGKQFVTDRLSSQGIFGEWTGRDAAVGSGARIA